MVAQLNSSLYFVWLLSIVLESLLFAISFRAQRHRLFSLYMGFCVFRSLLLFWASFDSPWTYWYGYWAGMMIEGALLLLVAGELAARVFRSVRYTFRTKRVALQIIFGAAALAVVVSLNTPAADMRAMAIGRAIERVVNLLLFLSVASMIGFSDWLGLPWKRHAYGIGLGLALYLSVSTVAQVIYSPFIMGPAAALRYVQMAGFILAEIVWIVYLRRPEPDVVPVAHSELREVQQLAARFYEGIGLLKDKTEVPDFTVDKSFVCSSCSEQAASSKGK